MWIHVRTLKIEATAAAGRGCDHQVDGHPSATRHGPEERSQDSVIHSEAT